MAMSIAGMLNPSFSYRAAVSDSPAPPEEGESRGVKRKYAESNPNENSTTGVYSKRHPRLDHAHTPPLEIQGSSINLTHAETTLDFPDTAIAPQKLCVFGADTTWGEYRKYAEFCEQLPEDLRRNLSIMLKNWEHAVYALVMVPEDLEEKKKFIRVYYNASDKMTLVAVLENFFPLRTPGVRALRYDQMAYVMEHRRLRQMLSVDSVRPYFDKMPKAVAYRIVTEKVSDEEKQDLLIRCCNDKFLYANQLKSHVEEFFRAYSNQRSSPSDSLKWIRALLENHRGQEENLDEDCKQLEELTLQLYTFTTVATKNDSACAFSQGKIIDEVSEVFKKYGPSAFEKWGVEIYGSFPPCVDHLAHFRYYRNFNAEARPEPKQISIEAVLEPTNRKANSEPAQFPVRPQLLLVDEQAGIHQGPPVSSRIMHTNKPTNPRVPRPPRPTRSAQRPNPPLGATETLRELFARIIQDRSTLPPTEVKEFQEELNRFCVYVSSLSQEKGT